MERVDPQLPAPVEVRIDTDHAGTVTVTLSGELDVGGIKDVQTSAAPIVAQAPRKLVVNVAELTFADSAAITMWLQWATMVEQFELRNPRPMVRQVLKAMGLAGQLGVES